jgi:hypothetical protein
MKKILLLLVAVMTAWAANAQLYVTGGGVEGAPASWNPSNPLTVTASNGYYTFQATDDFKISTAKGSSSSDWSTFNGSAKMLDGSWTTTSTSATASLKSGDSNISAPKSGVVVTYKVNTALTTIEASFGSEEVKLDFYIAGDVTSWNTSEAAYQLQTTDYKTYTYTATEAVTGAWKITTDGWGTNFGAGSAQPVVGTVYNLTYNSANNITTTIPAGATVTFTYNNGGTSTLLIEGGEEGGDEGGETTVDYTSWYVNVQGDFNEWANNGVNPDAEGLSKHEGLAIGTSVFQIKTWDATNGDQYFYYDGNLPQNEWVTLTNTYAKTYIANATTDQKFDVEFNCATKQVKVTPVESGEQGGGEEGGNTTVDYTSWYVNVQGDFNEWANNGVNPDAEGLSKHEGLAIGTSVFQIKTWDATNGDQYFYYDGNLPQNEWVTLTNTYAKTYIANATEGQKFDISYNCATNEIKVVAVEDGGDDDDDTDNLWKQATVTTTFYYAPGWSQIADPEVSLVDDTYTVNLTSATYEQWQAQMWLDTDISTTSTNNYDFSVVLNSSTDMAAALIKLYKRGDDSNPYFDPRITLTANEDYKFSMTDMPGKDIENLSLLFDFGGNAAGTVVKISDIVLKVHESEGDDDDDDTTDELILTGTFDDTELWAETSEKFVMDKEDNVYTLSINGVEAGTQFKIKTNEAGWDTSWGGEEATSAPAKAAAAEYTGTEYVMNVTTSGTDVTINCKFTGTYTGPCGYIQMMNENKVGVEKEHGPFYASEFSVTLNDQTPGTVLYFRGKLAHADGDTLTDVIEYTVPESSTDNGDTQKTPTQNIVLGSEMNAWPGSSVNFKFATDVKNVTIKFVRNAEGASKLTVTADEVVEDYDLTLTGTFNDWAKTSEDYKMTQDGNVYTYEFGEDVAAGTEFKIKSNENNWDTSWGGSAPAKADAPAKAASEFTGTEYVMNVTTSGTDVTINCQFTGTYTGPCGYIQMMNENKVGVEKEHGPFYASEFSVTLNDQTPGTVLYFRGKLAHSAGEILTDVIEYTVPEASTDTKSETENLVLGKATTAWAGSSVNFRFAGKTRNAVVTFNRSTSELTVTGDVDYILTGTFNDWADLDNDYIMEETDADTYTFTLPLPAGTEFKIKSNEEGWTNSYGAAGEYGTSDPVEISTETEMEAWSGSSCNFKVTSDIESAKVTFTPGAPGKVTVVPVQTGVEAIAADANNANAVYYNLQGIRVLTPEAGQVYIMNRGGKVSKVVIR